MMPSSAACIGMTTKMKVVETSDREARSSDTFWRERGREVAHCRGVAAEADALREDADWSV